MNILKKKKRLIKLHIIKEQMTSSDHIDILNNELNLIEQEMLDIEEEISKLNR